MNTAALLLVPAAMLFAQVPVVTDLVPLRADTGAMVTITGTGFSIFPDDNIVRFGAVRGEVTSASSTSLGVKVPAGGAHAPVSVTVAGRTGYSRLPFSVTFPSNHSFGPNSFSGRVDYSSVSSGPYRVALGDLDQDGRSDLVIANYQGNSCAIRRNEATGDTLSVNSFSAEADLGTGFLPVSLNLADIDGDGLLDIVIGHQFSSFVSVFRNQSSPGTITFDSRVDIPTSAGFVSVAVADFDGDGRPDLAVANRENNSVIVHLSTGNPGMIAFAPPVSAGEVTAPAQIVGADLDGDGRTDVAVADQGGATVSVLRNISTGGSLAFAARDSVDVLPSPVGLAAGDVTGDGILDLVVVHESGGTLSVLPGTNSPGSISFGARVDLTSVPGARNVALGDVDGDGRVDVAVVSSSVSSVAVHRNVSHNGTPGFEAPLSFAIATESLSAAIADVTANAKPELAAANISATSVSIYRNAVLPPPLIELSPDTLRYPDVAVGDSAAAILAVRNLSPAPLTVTSIVSGTRSFVAVAFLPAVIPGNDSLLVPVRFRPLAFGSFTDSLRIASDGGDAVVVLVGASPYPVLAGLPDTVDFGPQPQFSSMTEVVRVTNASVNALRVDSLLVRAPFSATIPDSIIAHGDTVLLSVTFQPETVGEFSDSVVVLTNGLPARRSVVVRGTGVGETIIPLGCPWSLVSVPRSPLSFAADSLFPNKDGVMFLFQNLTQNYEPVVQLSVGPGYWVRHAAQDTVAVAGTVLDSIVVDAVREGWVLLGSVTRPVGLSGIVTAPAGAIISPVFSYNIVSQLYEPAAEIRPGAGHWVKVDRPCRITVR